MKNRLLKVLAVLLSISVFSPLVAQQSISGHWEGVITVMGSNLGIMIDFRTEAESLAATIDIPQQNAKGLALKNIRYTSPKIRFELPAGPGLATFDGKVKADTISGDFTQGGVVGTFYLKRGEEQKPGTVVEEMVPYKQEEVKIINGDITLAGTLTLPQSDGSHPAVVMITGSGAQNRDEEIFGFKPFRIIADHLTRNGIAVLRCDDRGVGGSTGSVNKSTADDFAGDIQAAVKFLQLRSDINPKQIGLCGHSEGGIIAPLAASRSKNIAFIILLAGTGIQGDKVILKQIESLSREGGATDEEVQRALKLQQRVYETVRSDKGWEELKAEFKTEAMLSMEKMTPEQRKAIPDVDKFVDSNIEMQLKAAQTPWFKYFIDYDPAVALAKVKCPVLALFGELDKQVPAEINKQAMEKALKKGKNKNYSLHVFPNANHLFQTAQTGSPSEYVSLKKEFIGGFLDMMTDWILKRVRVTK
jgi:uncharacterized protein